MMLQQEFKLIINVAVEVLNDIDAAIVILNLFNGSICDHCNVIFSMFEMCGDIPGYNNYFRIFHKFILNVSITNFSCDTFSI